MENSVQMQKSWRSHSWPFLLSQSIGEQNAKIKTPFRRELHSFSSRPSQNFLASFAYASAIWARRILRRGTRTRISQCRSGKKNRSNSGQTALGFPAYGFSEDSSFSPRYSHPTPHKAAVPEFAAHTPERDDCDPDPSAPGRWSCGRPA